MKEEEYYLHTKKNFMTVVMEEKEKAEMLWIKLNNGVLDVTFGIVYMPQEDSKTVTELHDIYIYI